MLIVSRLGNFSPRFFGKCSSFVLKPVKNASIDSSRYFSYVVIFVKLSETVIKSIGMVIKKSVELMAVVSILQVFNLPCEPQFPNPICSHGPLALDAAGKATTIQIRAKTPKVLRIKEN